MIQSVIIFVFTALASSFLWWHSRFKICRSFLSRIRRWASVCHVCGTSNRVTNKALDKIPPGPKPDALTAEKVFGWKNVHKRQGALVGKKQDKAGHWRLSKVPYYSTNPVHAYRIEDRMKQLGGWTDTRKNLPRSLARKTLPPTGLHRNQRCRAAIKAVGHYGQVIPLSNERKQI